MPSTPTMVTRPVASSALDPVVADAKTCVKPANKVAGFLLGGLATGCCGTGVLTYVILGLGFGGAAGSMAGWLNMQGLAFLGFGSSVLLLLGITYLSVRKFRSNLPSAGFRRLYFQALTRTVGWAAASYFLFFMILMPVLSHNGIAVR